MFKKQKNRFLEIIQENNFDPMLFEAQEEAGGLRIKFQDSPFYFSVTHDGGYYYRYQRTRFLPGYPINSAFDGTKEVFAFEAVCKGFSRWLRTDLNEYLDELATPDLWEQINQEMPIVSESMFEGQDTSEFSNEEKAQLRLSLKEFRLLINENFDPTDDQMSLVDERLNYLSEALDRLNKFDWKSILLSSAVSIVTALSLDTARGKLLFDFLKQAFTHIVLLP